MPGEAPHYGSLRLAPAGSPPEAYHGGLFAFLSERVSAFRYDRIVYEAALDPRWKGSKTNLNTTLMLIGLIGVANAVAHQMGIRVMQADIGDVRRHMLGYRPTGDASKPAVMARARGMGFEPTDDNAADALMIWHFACDEIAAKSGQQQRFKATKK